MKISKSLLQAITLGLVIGTATSCTKDYYDGDLGIDERKETTQQTIKPETQANNDSTCPPGENPGFDCPACGLG